MQKTSNTTLGYILKGYPRISETFISNEIYLLEQLGFNIRLFPMRHPRETFSHASIKLIKAQTDYLPTEITQELPRLILANIILAAKKPEVYRRTLEFAAKKFQRNRKIATIKHLLQAGYLTNNLLDHDKSVVQLHGHFAHSPTSVTMFSSMLSGLPFSFTAHAKDIYTSNREHLKEKIDRAKFVVTCTKHNGEYLEELAQDSSTPIHTIYHGINTQLFSSVGATVAPEQPYRLMTVARITEKKGLPTIYQALQTLKEKGISFTHTLIGDGDDKQEIEQLIQDLKLTDCCTLLGTRTHDQVLDCFRSCDLFVLGCQIAKSGDRDGIPNVLVESLAMGVPAISTDVSAIPELLHNEKTGLVVTPSDPVAMASGIERMLTDTVLRKTCIDNGVNLVKTGFDNRDWTKKLAEVFKSENTLLTTN